MTVTRQITRMMRGALVSLLICAVLSAYVVSYLDSSVQPLNWIGLSSSGIAFAFYSLVLGAPVVVVYGVPVFPFLHSRGRANWPFVLLAGLLPGILLAPFYWEFAAIVAGFGILTGAAVRWAYGPGPNNSFKPKPLRGSA